MEEHDQLDVDHRRVRSDRLGADLEELAVAAGLRALVAEERAGVPELHRLGQGVHPVLDVGAADRRGPLGPKRQRPSPLVLEAEHLLLDDVGGLPDSAAEQLGVLERGGLDSRVPRGLEDPPRRVLDLLAAGLVGGERVEGAPRGLELLAHHQAR